MVWVLMERMQLHNHEQQLRCGVRYLFEVDGGVEKHVLYNGFGRPSTLRVRRFINVVAEAMAVQASSKGRGEQQEERVWWWWWWW